MFRELSRKVCVREAGKMKKRIKGRAPALPFFFIKSNNRIPFPKSIMRGFLGVRMSMDGRGRALDNVFVERLGRTNDPPYCW